MRRWDHRKRREKGKLSRSFSPRRNGKERKKDRLSDQWTKRIGPEGKKQRERQVLWYSSERAAVPRVDRKKLHSSEKRNPFLRRPESAKLGRKKKKEAGFSNQFPSVLIGYKSSRQLSILSRSKGSAKIVIAIYACDRRKEWNRRITIISFEEEKRHDVTRSMEKL